MPPRVDSVALLKHTMQMIREAHTDWDEDQVLECAFSVMNLQPNASQAEKIPKSVLSIISQIVKLNENNWAIWEPMFMDCIHPIKNARCILTGEIPSGHTDYDEELDSHLLGLILSSCDHRPTSHIDTYTVWEQGEEGQLSSTLYKKLKATLTINDKVKISAIHDWVHEVRLVHRNIANLGKELDQIWNDAARLGSRMDEKLKKSTLYCCIKDDWLYTQTVDSLKAAQSGCSYEYAYHTLAKKHQEAELSVRIRAAARITGNRNTTSQTSWPGQILNQEGYNRGRRDPANPNEPAKCYKCRQPGHITINCTNRQEQTPAQQDKNLLSIQALTEDGARVIFEESGATILQHNGSMVKSKTNLHKKRWEVYGDSLAAQLNDPLEGIDAITTPARPASHTTSKLWHERFGKETQLGHDARDCNCCSQAKQTRARMTSSKTERAQAPLELVHIDLMTDLKGHPNYHHTLVVVDDSSSYVYVKPLLSKAEAFPALKAWIKAAEIATDHTLKCIRSDNGTEWSSFEAEEWKREAGSLQERMHAMLVQRSEPKELWPYAIMAAGHTLNLTPSANASRIPYEDFHRKSAHGLAKQLRVFGCLAWVHLPKKDHAGKHGARAIPGIMIGYDDKHKGWKFFTPGHTPSMRWSNSATFHEAKGWHDRPSVRSPPQFRFESLEAESTRPKTDSDEPELEVEVLDVEDPLPKIYTLPPADPTDDNRSELDVEEMIGEAHMAVLNLTPTLKEALASDDVQQWQEAIRKELDGLEAMGTWEIMDVPPNTRLVDSKIVLQLKLDADGIPVRHKARLVTRGFTQREGIDFEETFAPVAPLSTIRALLSLAVECNWEVHQLDITMAYLNSTLNHVIYMKPPEGAKVPNGKAYRVVKGLYGLKQLGQEWNMEFDKFLRHSNFHRLDCAPCIYTRGRGDNFAIVVIYVDDTLIIAPTLGTVKRIKEEIGQRWRMEDSGNVSHFLGIKITWDREAKTMDLEQTSYVKQLLDEHLDKHRRKSSVPLQDIPVPETAASIAERKEYPQIVGKLLWLSNGTRLDISQAVGVLARYMTQPSREHYIAAQKVLQYLDYTRDTHLQYGSNKQQDFLMAHSDANWASDATAQCKSSSGSAVFVCGNLVAWKSALQRCTALSAVEAEFVAATEAAREVLFLEHLFKAIGIDVGIPTIFSDNTGTIQVSKDPAQHWKLKHIDTKYHFIRDNVQDRKVRIKYINTADNLADLFTKPVGKTTLLRAKQGLGLTTQQVTVARQPPALLLREAVEGDITKRGSRPG
ncbi:related to retrotransposon protein [Ustilago sp. UG-2017b]|nr:related to retrotransposon protein [Ustilago sp. UG-2017b]